MPPMASLRLRSPRMRSFEGVVGPASLPALPPAVCYLLLVCTVECLSLCVSCLLSKNRIRAKSQLCEPQSGKVCRPKRTSCVRWVGSEKTNAALGDGAPRGGGGGCHRTPGPISQVKEGQEVCGPQGTQGELPVQGAWGIVQACSLEGFRRGVSPLATALALPAGWLSPPGAPPMPPPPLSPPMPTHAPVV